MLISNAKKLLEHLSIANILKIMGYEVEKESHMLCPFHSESNPSFYIYGSRAKCFGCGWSGDSFDLIRSLNNDCTMEEALIWIEENADALLPRNTEFDRKRISKTNETKEKKERYWKEFIEASQEALIETTVGKRAVDWMFERGAYISGEIPNLFGVFVSSFFEKKNINFTRYKKKIREDSIVFPYYTLPNTLTAIKFRDIRESASNVSFLIVNNDNIGFFALNHQPPKDSKENSIIIMEGEVDVIVFLTQQLKEFSPYNFFPTTCCSGSGITKYISCLYKLGYTKPLLFLDNDSGGNKILKGILASSFVIGENLFVISPSDYKRGEDPASYTKRYIETGKPLNRMFENLFGKSSKLSASNYLAHMVLNDFLENRDISKINDDDKYELWRSLAEIINEYKLSGLSSYEYLKVIHKEITKWPEFKTLPYEDLTHSIFKMVTEGQVIKFLGGTFVSRPDGYYLKCKKSDEDIQITDFILIPYIRIEKDFIFEVKDSSGNLEEKKYVTLSATDMSSKAAFRTALNAQVPGLQVTWIDVMPNFLAVLSKQCVPTSYLQCYGWQLKDKKNPVDFYGNGWRIKDGKWEPWTPLIKDRALMDIKAFEESFRDYTHDKDVLRNAFKEYVNLFPKLTDDENISCLLVGFSISGLIKPLLNFKRGMLVIEGAPETGKTELATACNVLFTPFSFESGHLQISATSTITAFTILLSKSCGLPVILDDLKHTNIIRITGLTLEAMIQNYYDGQFRYRSNAELSIPTGFNPVGNLFCTAEMIPSGDAGVESRLLTITIGHGYNDVLVNFRTLEKLEERGADIPKLLPSFVQYLSKLDWQKTEKRRAYQIMNEIMERSRTSTFYTTSFLGLLYLKEYAKNILGFSQYDLNPLQKHIKNFKEYCQKVNKLKRNNDWKDKYDKKQERKKRVVPSKIDREDSKLPVGGYYPNEIGYKFLEEVSSFIDNGEFSVKGINQSLGIQVGHLDIKNKVVWLDPHVLFSALGVKKSEQFPPKSAGSVIRHLKLDVDARINKRGEPGYSRQLPIPIKDFKLFSSAVLTRVKQLSL